MPDRQKSIVSIPVVDPGEWENFPTLRETFLLYITDEEIAEALRLAGKFLYNLLLESRAEADKGDESATRSELHAALADLRHLQGFLETTGRECVDSSLSCSEDIRLSLFAARQAREISVIAKRIEEELEV